MKNKFKRESREDPERMEVAMSGAALDEDTLQSLEDYVHVSDAANE
jgi:hypothetical protein